MAVGAAACAAAAACNQGVSPTANRGSAAVVAGSGSSAPAPADAAPAAIVIAPSDASAIDATQFALFDHLPFRIVKAIPAAPRPAPPADLIDKPKLTVAASTQAVDLKAEVPPWCQHAVKKQVMSVFHTMADGSSIGATANQVVLVDADHHAELGLDLSGLHGTETDEGGEANTTPYSIVDAVRDGDLVAVAMFDPMIDSTTILLAGIDARTGALLWQTEPGVAQPRIAIARGYVLASKGQTLRAYRIDTGRAVASVTTPSASYNLQVGSGGAVIGAGDDGNALEVTLK
nr:hypothetical protein [Kofleriaceae bacterium]